MGPLPNCGIIWILADLVPSILMKVLNLVLFTLLYCSDIHDFLQIYLFAFASVA